MGRGSYKHFLAVAKKKPAIQDLLDKIDKMTRGEVEALSQPKWIKKHLLARFEQEEKIRQGYLTKEEIEQLSTRLVVNKNVKPPIFPVYSSMTSFMLGGTEIDNNDLLLQLNSSTIICNNIQINHIPAEETLKVKAKYIEDMSVIAFAMAVQKQLEEKYKDDHLPVIAILGDEQAKHMHNITGNGRFTITRH